MLVMYINGLVYLCDLSGSIAEKSTPHLQLLPQLFLVNKLL